MPSTSPSQLNSVLTVKLAMTNLAAGKSKHHLPEFEFPAYKQRMLVDIAGESDVEMV
jgi:hypothetical protein